MRFISHEPPKLDGDFRSAFSHQETERAGLVFNHYAYATEQQVAFKSAYYGSESNRNGFKYKDAVANWKRLQANTKWPVNDLKEFLPWVGDGVRANRIS